MKRPLSDEALVERTAEGDAAAFETLFDRHEPVLRARLGRMISPRLRSKISVSDLLQEARLAVYRGCAGFRPRREGSVRAWLLRIAELKALEAVRRWTGVAARDVAREQAPGSATRSSQVSGRGPSPSEVAMQGELQAEVLAVLDGLVPDHREVLRLVAMQGLTFVEAAGRMDRSDDAVRKLYVRALAAFTKRFQALRDGSSDA